MIIVKGISASEGISIGKIKKIDAFQQEFKKEAKNSKNEEIARFEKAKKDAIEKIYSMVENMDSLGKDQIEIFEIHTSMMEDPDFNDYILNGINSENWSAEYAVKSAQKEFMNMFSMMDDEYMKERAADVKDISQQILSFLTEKSFDDRLADDFIIGAENLTPSETISIDKDRLLGFFTKKGSAASHSSILARTLAIPAIVDIGDDYDDVKNDDMAIIDGFEGILIVNPDKQTIKEYEAKLADLNEKNEAYSQLKHEQAVTIDGLVVEINANIGNISDCDMAIQNGADGIGLFRSEFIYLNSHDYPTEENLFDSYKTVLEKMDNKRVVIRTLDIGADKRVDYFGLAKEDNPALGYRAIRICLNEQEIFYTQLRALYRASVFGKLAIMFPMIVSVDEVRKAKMVIEKVKRDLDAKGILYSKDIEIGIMIETPASVMVSDLLAKEVDFFSVGTNDLTQYTMAADRMNSKVAYLYDASNIAVLRMIKIATDNAHAQGKWIGVCGDSAADSKVIPYLLAMGIDELSMSPGIVPKVKDIIRKFDIKNLKKNYGI